MVDEKLRELGLAELPMMLLLHERQSKGELISRLEQVGKQRSATEVAAEYDAMSDRFENAITGQLCDAEAFATAVLCESEVEKADRAFQMASRLRRLPARWRTSSTLRHAHPR